MSKKIAIIGGGNLGVAMAEGLTESSFSIPSDIVVTRRTLAALSPLAEKGFKTTSVNIDAVKATSIVILAVKPFQVKDVLTEISSVLEPHHILISVVTGVLIKDMQEVTGNALPIFRAMPNTAIAIRQSITCLSYANATAEQVQFVNDLFSTVGKVVTIDEKLMDAATILGACGTAYAMRYIRANIQGGIEIGFDAATARLIAAQTVKGAAELLLQRNTHPEHEIDKVTTPRGCTIAGLNEMEHQGFSSSLIKGIIASYVKIAKD